MEENEMSYTKAFGHYGATLKNYRWAYSAIANDGSLVLSCWQRYLTPQSDGVLRYEVNDFSDWSANPLGKRLLQEHLEEALEEKLPVRMVLVATRDADAVVAGINASEVSKTFQVRDDLQGEVVQYTSERFVVEFRTKCQTEACT